MSPHGLVQELLNRSKGHLWAFVSNGLQLRILRDSAALTRQSFVEFDLESMLRDEVYPDFVLFWMLCHASRVRAERPEECWLEKWSKAAQAQGTRALDQLRDGVEKAITALGQGFLQHPENRDLRAALERGALTREDYYRQLLRLVYRLIFLFVAEDRDLLLMPAASAEAKARFRRFYGTQRLRAVARTVRGTPHGDLWQTLVLVMGRLGHDEGCPDLGLPALGSFLWSLAALGNLHTCQIGNRALPRRHPRTRFHRRSRRPPLRRLPQPRRRGTGQHLRVPAGTVPRHQPARGRLSHFAPPAATSARARAATTRPPAWSPACSTRPWTRCWTRPAASPTPKPPSWP